MKNNIINELRFASKKKKNAVLGYVYCDYLLDMFEEIEKLNNIRKEVKKYIKEHSTTINSKTMRADYNLNMNELLEILDKEENDGRSN